MSHEITDVIELDKTWKKMHCIQWDLEEMYHSRLGSKYFQAQGRCCWGWGQF